MIDRPDWGPKTDSPRETPGIERAPAAQAKPAAEDLAPVEQTDDEDGTEDLGRYRKMLADGILTADEIARSFALSSEEIEALSKPEIKPPSRRSIEQELAAIEKRLREDRGGYFKDEKAQARHLELIELRDKLKASPAAAKSEVDDGGAVPEGLDPALLEEWKAAGGVEHHLGIAQRTAQLALDTLEEGDRTAFEAGFDALPPTVQTQFFRFLAVEPSGAVRPADDAALQTFATTSEGAELVTEWGRNAARNVSIVRARMGMIVGAMTEADQEATLDWYDGLEPTQAKAVLKALAG